MMNFQETHIQDLLPQQPPFVMVDKLVHFDEKLTVTQLEVREDNLFFDDGRFTASGLIENIAQTCAARMGYINKYILKTHVKLGFIGSIRNLTVNRLPAQGEILTTTVEVMEEIFKMTLVNAVVKSGEEVLVIAEMKIALSDIDSQTD